MDNKFTIKFKGILDHASTKKTLERDISKLEENLKPKLSSLKSTKDIIKANLKDKNAELAKQNKYERLRERVEKFRLTETKKLMKQGHSFEKAKREAFKRSTMSTKDLRNLEFKSLKENSKMQQNLIKKNNLTSKVIIGSAIGNIIASSIKGASSNMFAFAKSSVKDAAERKRIGTLNSRIFNSTEKGKLLNTISRIKTFERGREKEEFLNKAAVIKSTLNNLGMNNETNMRKAVELAAKLKASGLSSSDDAISSVVDLLRGEGGSIFNLMSQFDKFGNKYLEHAERKWQQDTFHDMGSRITKLDEVLSDFNELNLTNTTSSYDSATSSMDKIDEELKKLTASTLTPLMDFSAKALKKINEFNFHKDIVDPIINGIKSIFSLDRLIARLKSILPLWMGGDSGESLSKITHEDKSITTPPSGT
ncbi:DUF759 family protein [Borrelia puertoricensis]|uniref:DUF759 family protein n=1 Tax=Borrelia puertoricensis TaxID=2756107 RepID=UPI001FF178AD|nr:DUF759 family protein [Borrelia puertoricensis]UPA18505.1 DUF759 family protein [Borrelia puertoricensis]UPA18775.1 DUF759 family protein [Borrelia puertoricensis]UPA18811.1 DUF759 family protein [Borrelia puertoricensis]